MMHHHQPGIFSISLASFLSPKQFYLLLGKCLPGFAFMAVMAFAYGLIGGLYWAPTDNQQGEAFRIIYVHVPSAILSLSLYSIIFFGSIIYLVWRIKVADIICRVTAPIGASYTLIALLTGALWGKPMWGTFWIWDARLSAELILLFLYLGYIALRKAIEEPSTAARLCGILALVGMIDIPIVHFSVEWWNTLHQGPSISRFAKPSIAPEMLYPLIAMIIAFGFFYLSILSIRSRTEILKMDRVKYG